MEALAIPSNTNQRYKGAVRFFGALNTLFCSIGFFLELLILIDFWRRGEPGIAIFYPATAISVTLLATLLAGSVYLVRLRRRGLAICAYTFVAELFYGFLLILAPTALEKVFGKQWVWWARP